MRFQSSVIFFTAISCFLLVLMMVRFLIASRHISETKQTKTRKSNREITAIVPFRNEYDTLKKTLPSLVREIKSGGNSEIIFVNSASEDATSESYSDLIELSGLSADRWKIISCEKPGKGVALNSAMQIVKNENIVINIDADVVIREGTLEKFRLWFEDEKIGAVSGTECVSESDHPMIRYKSYSNKLRSYESSIWGTVSLEGSLLAWDPIKIGWEGFDPSSNADDAQISFKTLTSGYRSIIDPNIPFHDSRDLNKGSFRRQIRRSQGLSSQIFRNLRLVVWRENKNIRNAYFSSFLLYIVIPWCVLFILSLPLILISTNSFQDPNRLATNPIFIPSALMYASILTKTGNNLVTGSLASVIGHLRALFRKRVNSWNPGVS